MKALPPFPPNPVLIVDDEAESLRSFALTLRSEGINHIVQTRDSREVRPLLLQRSFDALLLDLTMPFISGEDILSMVCEEYPEIPVIVITAVDELDTAVRCMKKGAMDYMVKPVEKNRLVSGVRRAIEIKDLRDQTRSIKEHMLSGEILNPEAFSAIITRNKDMLAIFKYMESITSSRQPILVTGETGVGKELMVKAIHSLSGSNCPLVSVNVAGLDDNVFSDTLFGHLKGAFTGAAERRQGLVEKAAGGILHLDEIGDLSHESQVKLLRLLQEGEYFQIGSDIAKMANTRVVATTNCDLSKLQESRRFRKDLYYRLSVHQIHIPPLRQRRDDVGLLLNHFVEEVSGSLNKHPPTYTEELVMLLTKYDFPGNIRELKTIVYDEVSRNNTGRISFKEFRQRVRIKSNGIRSDNLNRLPTTDLWRSLGIGRGLPTIEEATILLTKEALAQCDGNQSEAARMLGISRQRLARNLKK